LFAKTKFLKKFRERRDDGFTIVEAAITIPMLALVGGTMFFFMAQSLLIMQENNTTSAAGSQVKELADEIRNVKNCEQLRGIVKGDPTMEETVGIYNSNNDSVKPYYLKLEYEENSPNEKTSCNSADPKSELSGTETTVIIQARLGDISNPDSVVNENDKVLFETVSRINIQGVL